MWFNAGVDGVGRNDEQGCTMFTGLIAGMGRIRDVRRRGSGAAELSVGVQGWTEPPRIGESIAVQGVCLTVASGAKDRFCCHLLRETLERSNLGRLRSGDPVNLERALRVGDRLGGHWVSGHIDGGGVCTAIRRAGPDYVVEIRAASDLLRGVVEKGSIACDGISLTVAQRAEDRFSVHVIPHTWKATTLQRLRIGDTLNLETDFLGKYAAGRGDPIPAATGGLTMEHLRQSGFAV